MTRRILRLALRALSLRSRVQIRSRRICRPLSHLSVQKLLSIWSPREGWTRRFAPRPCGAHFVRLSSRFALLGANPRRAFNPYSPVTEALSTTQPPLRTIEIPRPRPARGSQFTDAKRRRKAGLAAIPLLLQVPGRFRHSSRSGSARKFLRGGRQRPWAH